MKIRKAKIGKSESNDFKKNHPPHSSATNLKRPLGYSPATEHEKHELASAIASIRSGDPELIEEKIAKLEMWSPRRLRDALIVSAQRYITIMAETGLIHSMSASGVLNLVDAASDSIPEVVKPPKEVLLSALSIVASLQKTPRGEFDIRAENRQLLALVATLNSVGGQSFPHIGQILGSSPIGNWV